MIDFINQHEPVLRALVFASSLGLLAAFEVLFPRRFLGARLARWRTNFLLGGANMFLLRIVLPGGLVALALSAYGGGVFGRLLRRCSRCLRRCAGVFCGVFGRRLRRCSRCCLFWGVFSVLAPALVPALSAVRPQGLARPGTGRCQG